MSEAQLNRTILCIDDDHGILDAYRSLLAASESAPSAASILQEAGLTLAVSAADEAQQTTYDLILAASGSEALHAAEFRMSSGGRIAASFVDMKMPGLNGLETIRALRKLDSQIHCAVVTAYTEKNLESLRDVFTGAHQDELLYFSKPFGDSQLRQAALNMVSSWNRKRQLEEKLRIIEANRKGLRYILQSTTDLLEFAFSPKRQAHLSVVADHLMILSRSSDVFFLFDDLEHSQTFICKLGAFASGSEAELRQLKATSKVYIRDLTHVSTSVGRIGVLYPDANSSLTADLLDIYAQQLTQLLISSFQKKELVKVREDAITDQLTGLYNRKFIEQELRSHLYSLQKPVVPISVILIDLDHFKHINDTYGHDAGDAVLKQIGHLIRTHVRTADIVQRLNPHMLYALRLGGEEFLLILCDISEKVTAEIATRLRESIEAYDFKIGDGQTIQRTASIGISFGKLKLSESIEDSLAVVVRAADKALYLAKSEGRNRVKIARLPKADRPSTSGT